MLSKETVGDSRRRPWTSSDRDSEALTMRVGDHDPPARPKARVSLAPVLYEGTLDGGWWPRTSDVAAELDALVTTLPARVGPVTRVSLNVSSWPDHPRRVRFGAAELRLGWLTAMDPHVVTLSQPGGRVLILLVVPPQAVSDSAARAMGSAAAGHAHDHPARILVEAGVIGDGRADAAGRIRTTQGLGSSQVAADGLSAGHLGTRGRQQRIGATV